MVSSASPIRNNTKMVTFSPIPEVIPADGAELRHKFYVKGEPTAEVPLQAQTRVQQLQATQWQAAAQPPVVQ